MKTDTITDVRFIKPSGFFIYQVEQEHLCQQKMNDYVEMHNNFVRFGFTMFERDINILKYCIGICDE